MEDAFKQCLWKNFGAAIDMLSDVVELCPGTLWQSEKKFFYLSYHTLIFLDYYLSQPAKDFQATLPYTIVAADKLPPECVDDVIPDAFYSQAEILAYLASARSKCQRLILSTPPEAFGKRWIEDSEIEMHGLCPSIVENYTLLEILFYNLRHVQHHVAQLNFILRQKTNEASDWISHAE
jgi:hypothetical protein